MTKKLHTFEIKLNSISDTDTFTKKEVEFILHDFEVNNNNTFISKETSEKTLGSLDNMPIVCKYYDKVYGDDDALGGHEVTLGEGRDSEDKILEFNTTAIGTFTDSAYIKTIFDEEGNEKEVVCGKGVLWASRYPNIVGLLKEWSDNGVEIVSSMEIAYDSYKVENGVEEILDYVYEGHCILNSEDRGEHSKVAPAYDVSKLTRLVAQAMNKESGVEEPMADIFKKVFQLSHNEIRTQMLDALEIDQKNGNAWIYEVYDDYVIVNEYSWEEDNTYDKFFKYNYTREGDVITVDLDSKVEIERKVSWIEKTEVEELQSQFEAKSTELEEVKTKLSEVELAKEEVSTAKVEIEKQFNEATEKLTQLNTEVETLKPFKEQFEKSQFEAKFAEVSETYEGKFKALNSEDKFNEESVQELLKKSVFETDEGISAKTQLNSILVDLVVLGDSTKVDKPIQQQSSKRENLLDVNPLDGYINY